MKYSFNFVRITNWVYVVRTKLKDLRLRLDEEELSQEEVIELLEQQKKQLLSLRDILDKKIVLMGINKDFLANLQQIKKDYGIED